MSTRPSLLTIESSTCDSLDLQDVFFDSLRKDYIEFDSWFAQKCLMEHRKCFVIRDNHSKIVGVCIYKRESPLYEMDGLVIKMCTFKSSFKGHKHGELLLRRMLERCYELDADWLYVTAYQNNSVCPFLEEFGFERYKERKEDTGELIYRKKLKPVNEVMNLSSCEFHRKYGIRYFNRKEQAFLVPLKEGDYDFLFPETSNKNEDLLRFINAGSNAIRKKIRSQSNTKKIQAGSILFFCKSQPSKIIKCCGIVEKVFRSTKYEEIKEFIGQEFGPLQSLKRNSAEWLCIQFRRTEDLSIAFSLDDLMKKRLIKRYPRVVTKISDEVKNCILKNMPY